MIIFFRTSDASKSGIHRDFGIMNLKDFMSSCDDGRPRCESFAILEGESTGNIRLKQMTLDIYEKYLTPNNWTHDQITRWFGVDISKKYGRHSITDKIKNIPNKDLKFGKSYKTSNGTIATYLGKVRVGVYYPAKNGRPEQKLDSKEGFFIPKNIFWSYPEKIAFKQLLDNGLQLQKTPTKFVEELASTIVGLDDSVYNYSDHKGDLITIEFLDYESSN